MFYPLAKLTCLSLGLYYSFKAVRSRNKERGMQWLTFWVVMAFYRVGEFVADIFLGWWLPFYGYFKLLAILFVLFTQPWGAEAMYKQHLRPLFRSNQYHVEDFKRNYGSYIMNLSRVVVSIALTLTSLIFSLDASKGAPSDISRRKENETLKEPRQIRAHVEHSRATPTRSKATKGLHEARVNTRSAPAANAKSFSDIRSKFQQEETCSSKNPKMTLGGRRLNLEKPLVT
ncbi:hypothetical protein K493DRAFT_34760 [Basidiobolus meristosporus CBS 931.73]|uniref:Protein YOP1 n=1 Tax=Basidiobolus meristosporus CBS 931.73 TaxID=1314790 RepID=A0A1Y1Y6W9_9FUNG|nr:hypothetical protein K493DRAFT_34760 [Basidiobolus meristosporus CBS 931.73]|eukprot:ORX93753.1 hypothetical protein K493DRAFT_34760 [Basidiobolus meristosporus CBS 931.73]